MPTVVGKVLVVVEIVEVVGIVEELGTVAFRIEALLVVLGPEN